MTVTSQDRTKLRHRVVETIVNSHKHSDHPPLPTAPGYEAILNQRFHVLASSWPYLDHPDTREGFLQLSTHAVLVLFSFLPCLETTLWYKARNGKTKEE